MLQRFVLVFLVLALLSSMTVAQVPCSDQGRITDSNPHSCPMKDGNGKCNKVMFVVTGLNNASNTGVHLSSITRNRADRNTVGTECAIITKKNYAWMRCREFIAKRSYGEIYAVPLGNQGELDAVMIAVSQRLIKITVNKHSISHEAPKNKSPGTKLQSKFIEKIPYVVEAIIPLNSDSGFCSSTQINYKANGLLYRTRGVGEFKFGRHGSGYKVSAYVSP